MAKLREVYNDAVARAEGWIICFTDEWGDVIMKYDEDEAERFDFDDTALAYVTRRADEGSDHHRDVLAALDAENPAWRGYYE